MVYKWTRDIVENLCTIIRGYDPESQQEAIENIYIAGGGSRIKNLAKMIQDNLKDFGKVKVKSVQDPDYMGAMGALKMATDLPPQYWDKVGFLGGAAKN